MNRTDTTTGTTGTVTQVTTWGWVPQKPSRVAKVIDWFFDRTCANVLRHYGACSLMNRRICIGYDEKRDRIRIVLPNPFYRLVCWASDAAEDQRWTKLS